MNRIGYRRLNIHGIDSSRLIAQRHVAGRQAEIVVSLEIHLGRKILPRTYLSDDARRTIHGRQRRIAPTGAGHLPDSENVPVIPQYLTERMSFEARIEIYPVISRGGPSVVIPAHDDAGRLGQLSRRIGLSVGFGKIDPGNRNGIRFARRRYDRSLRLYGSRKYRRRSNPRGFLIDGFVGCDLDFVVRAVYADALDP